MNLGTKMRYNFWKFPKKGTTFGRNVPKNVPKKGTNIEKNDEKVHIFCLQMKERCAQWRFGAITASTSTHTCTKRQRMSRNSYIWSKSWNHDDKPNKNQMKKVQKRYKKRYRF